MKMEQTKMGTVDVLTPVGALVDDEAEEFRKRLLQRLASPNVRVVLCLNEVPYMDGTALEALLGAADELADRADTLRLADVTPTCREILELTGLAGRFRFFSTLGDAVKSFL
jgi:anti-anti-sigma factor